MGIPVRLLIVLSLLLPGCLPHGPDPIWFLLKHTTPRPGQIEESPAEAETREQKRQLENAAARATGDRLERERKAAATARAESSSAQGDVVSAPPPVSPTRPESLDPAMIREAIGSVKSTVMSCSTQSSVKGQVLVSLKVNADGQVSDVTVNSTPDSLLGTCVATAVREATFAKTQRGGTFRYPFVFRGEVTISAD